MTCQCFLSSAISVVIWFLVIASFARSRHFSVGLPRFRFSSTVICNIYLVVSSSSRLCPNHLNLFSLRNSAIGYQTWGESTFNDSESESDSGRLLDSECESDSSQFGYDSESNSDSSNISISDSESDSNFQLLI